jgi:hypothetical protein
MAVIHASSLDTSPPEYVVEGMLPDMGCGFGYGDSYTGKTLALAIELCLAIANGMPYFGHETIRGSAAWLIGEGLQDAGVRIKARLIREQYDRKQQAIAIARMRGDEAAEAWLESLPPYTDDRMFVRTSAFTVPFTAGTPGSPSEDLRQAARELGMIEDLRLIVLDTARRFTDLSLSNGTTGNRFMKGMAWLAAQLQCTVMAIGHPVSKGRGETGLPGDTLFGASDFVWRVQAGEDSTDEAPNAMIIGEKVKSGPLFAPVAYELERISWRQPPTDPETGEEIPGELIRVNSVTVRQRADDTAEADATAPAAPARPARPLPEAEAVPPSRPRRRTGVLPKAGFRSVTPVPQGTGSDQSEDERERAALITALISGTCPDYGCGKPPGISCNPGTGEPYTVLALQPLVVVHNARVQERLTAGAADATDVRAQFDAGDRFLAELGS